MSNLPSRDSRSPGAPGSPLQGVEAWRSLAESAHEPFAAFVAGIAHDIRNMFAVIGTTAQDLQLSPDAALEGAADHAAALRVILDATGRGADLASQLQRLARHNPPAADLVDLNDVVRSTVRLARRVMSVRIAVLDRLDAEGAPVWGNATLLEQVVMNLLLNARDAIEAGGGNGAIALSTRRDHGRTVLRVEDTGVGMTEALRARIFEFGSGTHGEDRGVGLATVRAIVNAAGGSISVESAPGLGASFEVHLPRSQEATPAGG